jgi:hypothetical protein
MRVGASFRFPPHVSEAAVRTMASYQNARLRPRRWQVRKTEAGLVAIRVR